MKFFKMSAFFLLLFFIQFESHCSTPEILPINEIKPGMKGTCLTIFEGPQIEEFGVEVIEVMKNYAPHCDIILVRLLGPKVEKTGVVSGMSGSPVYFDNKLAGALCYRFGVFQKEPIGGVMPIGQMLDIMEKEKYRDEERISQQSTVIFPYQSALFIDNATPASFLTDWTLKNVPAYNCKQSLAPIKTPLAFSGFQPSTVEKFRSVFEQYGFEIVIGSSSGNSSAPDNTQQLLPGTAISGVIVDGDMSISATGTVTYRDGDKVLAFGHPFLGFGPINLPMASSKILTTLSSLYYSVKMSEVGAILGAFHQDRNAGVMGIIGEKADMFPVSINYNSPFENRQTFQFRIAEDKSINSMTPLFLWFALLNIMDSARMAQSDYHTQLTGEIILKNHDNIIFNDFYGGSSSAENDVVQSTLKVALTTAAILLNEFTVPDIEQIKLEFNSGPGKKIAEIDHVWYDKSTFKPGDSINLLIFLQPYQREQIKIAKKLRLPKNIAPGRYSIFIGSRQFIDAFERRLAPGKYKPQNLKQLIRLLNRKRKNNELFIQLRQPTRGTLLNGQEFTSLPPSIMKIMDSKKTSGKMNMLRDQLVREVVIPLEWMLSGGKTISIRVKDK